MKKLYRFTYEVEDFRECLYGLFITNEDTLKSALSFWEEEEYGYDESCFELVTIDQFFISKFEEFNLESGFNPIVEAYQKYLH